MVCHVIAVCCVYWLWFKESGSEGIVRSLNIEKNSKLWTVLWLMYSNDILTLGKKDMLDIMVLWRCVEVASWVWMLIKVKGKSKVLKEKESLNWMWK